MRILDEVAFATERVMEVIHQNRTDLMFSNSNSPLSPTAILYTYGSDHEFKNIVVTLEEMLNITIDSYEIGELTAELFLKSIILEVQKQGINCANDVAKKGYNTILYKGEHLRIASGKEEYLIVENNDSHGMMLVSIHDVEQYQIV